MIPKLCPRCKSSYLLHSTHRDANQPELRCNLCGYTQPYLNTPTEQEINDKLEQIEKDLKNKFKLKQV